MSGILGHYLYLNLKIHPDSCPCILLFFLIFIIKLDTFRNIFGYIIQTTEFLDLCSRCPLWEEGSVRFALPLMSQLAKVQSNRFSVLFAVNLASFCSEPCSFSEYFIFENNYPCNFLHDSMQWMPSC